MISPAQCPVCKFDGIVESDELEWEDEQVIDFRCKRCDQLWKVKVTMQAEILPSASAEHPGGTEG